MSPGFEKFHELMIMGAPHGQTCRERVSNPGPGKEKTEEQVTQLAAPALSSTPNGDEK